MILVKKADDLGDYIKKAKKKSGKIGFVPTMGALHDGHLSLIRSSVKDNPVTVCSIFINPTQFNDINDFERYPVTIEKDISLLQHTGCNVLFLPSVKEIYPHGLQSAMHYDLGYLETILEGKFRPGHFQGVCQVMDRLLHIVQPSDLYMGQKDYQQCLVVKRLLGLSGIPATLHPCETLREADGLAMSSRNLRLNPEERQRATTIYQALTHVSSGLVKGSLDSLVEEALQMLKKNHFRTDYFEIADAETLHPAGQWDGQRKLVALVAAFINDVRLIDNMLITG